MLKQLTGYMHGHSFFKVKSVSIVIDVLVVIQSLGLLTFMVIYIASAGIAIVWVPCMRLVCLYWIPRTG